MSDEEGHFPLSSLNEWERDVVKRNSPADAVGWYRNPPRPRSTRSASRTGTERQLAVDAPGLHLLPRGGRRDRASIIDPHGHHLDDADAKLRALAEFAEKYGESFYRIEAISQVDNSMRVLDLQESAVRDAVRHRNESAVEFYYSDIAVDYDTSKVHAHGRGVNH